MPKKQESRELELPPDLVEHLISLGPEDAVAYLLDVPDLNLSVAEAEDVVYSLLQEQHLSAELAQELLRRDPIEAIALLLELPLELTPELAAGLVGQLRQDFQEQYLTPEIVAEVLSRETSTKKRKKRRHACLLFAFAWAVCLAGVLAVMKCMVGFMWVGIDFTAGMAHQRGAKKKWRARRNLSVGGDLDALNDGGARGAGRGDDKNDSFSKTYSSPPSPARVLKPRADRNGGATGDVAAGAFARKKGGPTMGLATGRRRATRL